MSLFKKGSSKKPGNYKPVNLTSVLGKLLESILMDKINMHLDERGLSMDG